MRSCPHNDMMENIETEKHSCARVGRLQQLIGETDACMLRPLEFFVAWHGVLTIAYTGFPSPLHKLKQRINGELVGIMNENPGSMWPKTTLACLKDTKSLSLPQLVQLRDICRQDSATLLEEQAIIVNNISIVLYQNCCLEKTLMVSEIPLKNPVDTSEPLPDEVMHVRSVLDDFADSELTNYYPHVIREGNPHGNQQSFSRGNRTAHYQAPKVGSTIVHFLFKPFQSLARFKEKVEAAIPGMYDWFLHDSLHITIRALT